MDVCEINHTGSAEVMEKGAVIEKVLHSIARHKVRYTVYGGDGASSSYGYVSVVKIFGSECSSKR